MRVTWRFYALMRETGCALGWVWTSRFARPVEHHRSRAYTPRWVEDAPRYPGCLTMRARACFSPAALPEWFLIGRLLAILCMATSMTVARAGGGPENLFVVVNPASTDSLAVANAFIAARDVPPINTLMLPWKDSTESTTTARFRSELLAPVLRAIDSRRLAPQIDCVVWSSDFPWRIDFRDELPPDLAAKDRFPSASLTGMTMLFAAVQSGVPAWLDAESNDYFRPLDTDGVPQTTVGFRSWYGWGPNGELLEAGGSRYLLSAMLGVTSGRGNTSREVAAYLRSAARADGTKPKGTVYFMTNGDVRTTTRSVVFPAAVRVLDKLGVKAEIVSGVLPSAKKDVAGLMTGTPSFDWRSSGSTILPGAICENLTSFGAIFTPSAGQTPLSEFLRYGAAGSSGTVIEPYSIQAKFPHAAIQVHYARGASLAEAFYQSVRSPYQLLVVGDPLCQPWASIPTVEVVNAADSKLLESGATLSDTVELEPRATMPGEGVVDRFELFVDGMRLTECGPGGRLVLDTTMLADGHHDVRVVAIESSPVETQGRSIIPVLFANHDRAIELTVEPLRTTRTGTVRVAVKGKGIEGAVVFALGRVLGRISGSESSIEVPAELLGVGTVMIRATGRGGPKPADGVNAVPVLVDSESASACGRAARWHRGGGRHGGRRTLEELGADPRPGDETFAAPEPAIHGGRMRSSRRTPRAARPPGRVMPRGPRVRRGLVRPSGRDRSSSR